MKSTTGDHDTARLAGDIVENSVERENLLLFDPRVPIFRLYECQVCYAALFEAPENVDLVSRGAPLYLNVVLNSNRADICPDRGSPEKCSELQVRRGFLYCRAYLTLAPNENKMSDGGRGRAALRR